MFWIHHAFNRSSLLFLVHPTPSLGLTLILEEITSSRPTQVPRHQTGKLFNPSQDHLYVWATNFSPTELSRVETSLSLASLPAPCLGQPLLLNYRLHCSIIQKADVIMRSLAWVSGPLASKWLWRSSPLHTRCFRVHPSLPSSCLHKATSKSIHLCNPRGST